MPTRIGEEHQGLLSMREKDSRSRLGREVPQLARQKEQAEHSTPMPSRRENELVRLKQEMEERTSRTRAQSSWNGAQVLKTDWQGSRRSMTALWLCT